MAVVTQAGQTHRRDGEFRAFAYKGVKVVNHVVDVLLCLCIAVYYDVAAPQVVP